MRLFIDMKTEKNHYNYCNPFTPSLESEQSILLQIWGGTLLMNSQLKSKIVLPSTTHVWITEVQVQPYIVYVHVRLEKKCHNSSLSVYLIISKNTSFSPISSETAGYFL